MYPEKIGTRVMHEKTGADAISLIEPCTRKKKQVARFQVTEWPQAWQADTAPSDVSKPKAIGT